jgi:hypothetical protein
MMISKIKNACTALLVLALAGTTFWQARAWASLVPAAETNESNPARNDTENGTYRVTVRDVIREETTLVTQIEIEGLPGALLEVTSSDKRKSNVLSASLSDRPGSRPTIQLTLFADLVDTGKGVGKVVKFSLGYKVGKTSGSVTDTTSVDAATLDELLKVFLKPGEHRLGQPLKLASFRGVAYTLSMDRAK